MRRVAVLVSLSFVVAVAALAACSRSARQARPVATLSTSPEAQLAFAEIHERWESGRLEAVPYADFIKRFPGDGATPLAKVYLAFALLESGDRVKADGVLAELAELEPGSTRDLADVARARSLRLYGAPQSALDLLRPLVGKIVDEADREMFLEELALTAIAAHDDYEALAYLDAWLRGVGEDDRDRVRAKIAQILDTLPRGVLEQTYRTMRARGVASGYTADTQKLVAARLARIAVETNDAALARWLLDLSGTSAAQAGGDAGLELGELAASRRGLSVVAGKTVGVLLPTRELRDEAADVVRGVSWALDLPRRAGASEGVRLITRDDGVDEAGTRAAMEELAGEGAAVILAGFDRASADRASAWSEQNGLPVLLLSSPSAAKLPRTSAYVLGERTEREIGMLAEALVRHGVKTAALVVDAPDDQAAASSVEARSGLVFLPPIRCDVPLAEAGKPRFPVASWLASGAQGWIVSGPSSCARDVLRDVRRVFDTQRQTADRWFGVTLESGIPPAEVPRGIALVSASAGLVPIVATRPEEAREEDVRAFMERFGVRPSYWTAIGRDAGVLARAALAPLPPDTTSDLKSVTQRRAIVQAGLSAARVRLWTTDDRGFGRDRILPRALRIATSIPTK
ncbi:MAG: amino acid ABC transporter substrate-binding protein [Labilithrix sp.]|nr:amino acid ABC transporter substrate-binding protein [Labilithrix sp.]